LQIKHNFGKIKIENKGASNNEKKNNR